MSDADRPAVDDDEDCYIPVELVIITSQIGPSGILEISRWPIPTTTISQAALEGADLLYDFIEPAGHSIR